MSKLKEAASLTSALLAKKGRAAPSEYMPPSTPVVDDADPHDFVSPVKPLRDFNQVQAIADKPNDELTIDHSSGRVRLSLRLDPKRHMALQNTATHLHKSSQQIITEALDSYLNLALSILGGRSTRPAEAGKANGGAQKDDGAWRKKASQAKQLAAKRLADKKSGAGQSRKSKS